MLKKVFCVLLVCVTLVAGISMTAFAKASVSDVSGFEQTKATSDSVTLKWNKVSGASGYRIYVYDKDSGKYRHKGFFKTATAVITGLSSAETYTFKIKAYVRQNGKRVYCKNFKYLKTVTAPKAVTNLKVSGKKSKSFILSWDKVGGADGYIIQRLNTESGVWHTYKTVSGTSRKMTREGYFRVVAYKLNDKKKILSAGCAEVNGKFKYVYSESGTFTFTVYGYGHGVGMSQVGASAYAEKGWDYKKILTHYYSGTVIKKDEEMPQKVKYKDKKYTLKQYLYRVTQVEIGSSVGIEAIKAQAVACYSYAKYKNFKLTGNDHAFCDKDAVSDKVKNAVDEVLGEYVSYNGKACLTPYFHSSAGKTVSCEAAWGSKLNYLVSVSSEVDKKDADWKTTYSIKSEDFKESFAQDFDIELSGDPSKWFKIISHDDAVSKYIGYVGKISVGSKVFSGESFKYSVMHSSIRSHCFTISYKPD